MAKYEGFIPQNVAMPNASKIAVYNPQGKQVGTIALRGLKFPNAEEKLYSFGALSDVHYQYDTAPEDFHRALTYLNETEDVAFTCICGDLTSGGTVEELTAYKNAVDAYSPDTPVYAIMGNHDIRAGQMNSIQNYTGHPTYYTIEHGNDVFIFVGNVSDWTTDVLSTEELQWLYETLEENRNKRCFLFQHIRPTEGCGNALGLYDRDGVIDWGGTCGAVFESLLSHYPNVVFFHGHSHLKFYLQEHDEQANYDNIRGCHSVHIPSLAVPRDSDWAVKPSYVNIYADSEGYVVDVYENGVHLRGRDFIKGEFLPIASYWVDTTIQEVAEGTYWDDTGTVFVNDLRYSLDDSGDYYICTGTRYDLAVTAVEVPASWKGKPVLGVGSGAFSNLTELTKITFKTTPTNIAADAFAGCDSMATVVMPCASDVLDTSPWGSGYLRPRFEIGGVIYRRHSTTSIDRYVLDGITSAFHGGLIEFVDYIGGTPVYELDASSFKNKTTITGVIIPATVKAIEASVFAGCTGLTNVTFKGTPSSIPATVFDGCTNLLDIYVPWAEGAVANAPWGATNATIHYNAT